MLIGIDGSEKSVFGPCNGYSYLIMRCCKSNVLSRLSVHFGPAESQQPAQLSGCQVLVDLPVCNTVDVPELAELRLH